MMTVCYDKDPRGKLTSATLTCGEKGAPAPQNLSLAEAIRLSPVAYVESVDYQIPKGILDAYNDANQSY